MISDAQKVRAKEDLQEVVDEFNTKFNSWMERTGCRADFGWTYHNIKGLEIRSIDLEVYRKPPPEGLGRFAINKPE